MYIALLDMLTQECNHNIIVYAHFTNINMHQSFYFLSASINYSGVYLLDSGVYLLDSGNFIYNFFLEDIRTYYF